jgi:hypothetical protein
MARRHISQHEAHRLLHTVNELRSVLEKQRNQWTKEWPEAIHLGTIEVTPTDHAKISTARRLRHAVVLTLANGAGPYVELYASALPAGDRQ